MEHVRNSLQNITTERTPQRVLELTAPDFPGNLAALLDIEADSGGAAAEAERGLNPLECPDPVSRRGH